MSHKRQKTLNLTDAVLEHLNQEENQSVIVEECLRDKYGMEAYDQ